MQTTKEYSGFFRVARCRTDCSKSFSGTSLPEQWIDGDGPDLPDQWFICIEYATYSIEFSKASGPAWFTIPDYDQIHPTRNGSLSFLWSIYDEWHQHQMKKECMNHPWVDEKASKLRLPVSMTG